MVDVRIDHRAVANHARLHRSRRTVRRRRRHPGEHRPQSPPAREPPVRARHRREERHGTGEREIRIACAQHRTRRRRYVLFEDHGSRTRRREQFLVFRIGQERDVSGLRVLYAGDARDVEFTVSFEPAVQSSGQFAQLHWLIQRVMLTGLLRGHAFEERRQVPEVQRRGDLVHAQMTLAPRHLRAHHAVR